MPQITRLCFTVQKQHKVDMPAAFSLTQDAKCFLNFNIKSLIPDPLGFPITYCALSGIFIFDLVKIPSFGVSSVSPTKRMYIAIFILNRNESMGEWIAP